MLSLSLKIQLCFATESMLQLADRKKLIIMQTQKFSRRKSTSMAKYPNLNDFQRLLLSNDLNDFYKCWLQAYYLQRWIV